MGKSTFFNVLSTFVLIKSLQLIIVYYAPVQFDTSSPILLDLYQNDFKQLPTSLQRLCSNLLNKLVVWDSVYFAKLSSNKITFEHEWVFGPLWWRLINFFQLNNFYWNFIFSLIISNTSHFLSSLVIYHLTRSVFQSDDEQSHTKVEKLANVAAILTVLQPSGVFSTANYTESIAQLCCYLGLYLHQISISQTKIRSPITYILSGTLFTLAFGFRSNCLLYGIVFLYDLLQYNTKQPFSSIIAIFTGIQLFAGFLYLTWLPYSVYCPERGEWCVSLTKSLVTYSQAHYWNNGFLKYFTVGNLPLFLIASPTLFIIGLSIIHFRNFERIKSIWIVSVIYFFLQATAMHVQIVNRVSTFIPLHIWFVSWINVYDNNTFYLFSRKFSSVIVKWWVIWVLVQTALYSCFLPPA